MGRKVWYVIAALVVLAGLIGDNVEVPEWLDWRLFAGAFGAVGLLIVGLLCKRFKASDFRCRDLASLIGYRRHS